jgi:hypothetical protein
VKQGVKFTAGTQSDAEEEKRGNKNPIFLCDLRASAVRNFVVPICERSVKL